ncbi:MAG: SDR family NAD(P)-dependent oxidoreductase [Acidimicrobiia bacterium]|nr:SDR family NAD(P)-dependent oxidoreductase [Acidimicrobiia bacterium]
MDLQLDGKRALVTGGSKGIGKAVARSLAAEGCDVAIAARTRADLDATAAELAASTERRIVAVVMDTGSDTSVRQGVAEATAALGGIDILVNSAAQPMGQAAPPRLADITDELFWNDVNVKVMGYLRCAREVAPQMAERGWGRIVNISGLGARTVGSAVGSARNVAVAAMTKNLADELGPQGVNVTVVHPGLTRTEATPGVVAARAAAAGTDEATVEAQLARSNSIRKLVDADEVAWVVTFLASPRAISINGDAVACGGGQPGVIHY